MTRRGGPLLAGTALLAIATGLGLPTSDPASAAALASITIDPDSGPAGTVIKVVGARFCPSPCTSVTIRIANLIVATDVRVSSAGEFTTVVEVPGNARPTQVRVLASQRDANGATSSAFTPFYVTPELPPPVYYTPPTGDPALPAGAVTNNGAMGPQPSASASASRAAATAGPASGGRSGTASNSAPPLGSDPRAEDARESSRRPWVLGAAATAGLLVVCFLWSRRRHRPT